ncbi:hypothetical protein DPMN_165487 [Dreissena polymorpha]|uniref:Uncharacterized protein n=1 Tax=Dreissena polymorpha TaxID=45954 RepID=A0A9D4EXP5_DREPO|nr:hypothetical protein DPMN_165487 [Dreissena polymorpha]
MVPFLDRVASKYLKLVTYLRFSSFKEVSELVLLVLFTLIVDLNVLITYHHLFTCSLIEPVGEVLEFYPCGQYHRRIPNYRSATNGD